MITSINSCLHQLIMVIFDIGFTLKAENLRLEEPVFLFKCLPLLKREVK